jgi:multiple sugar transport system substrate-binding protein
MIELTGMTWDHTRGYDPMVATADAYARSHPDVRITWTKRSLQAFADAPLEELAERFDLLVIDHPHVGLVSRSKCLLTLDTLGRDADLAKLKHETVGPSHVSYEYEGHQWALAIDAATQVASYRPDLIARADVPTTWGQVLALAKVGKVIWPCKPVDALMSFFTLAASRGTPCASDGSKRLIAPEPAKSVLTYLCELALHVPAECLSMNPPQAYERMAESDRFIYCPLGYGYTNYSRDGYRAHKLAFTNIAGVKGSAIGGTGIAVSAHCKHPEVAADYAFWIAGAECQKTLYFDAGGQPGNAVAWEDDRCNAASLDFFKNTRETLETVYLRPRYDGYLEFQDTGGDVVNACLAGRISIEQAVADLQARYEETLP